MNSSYTHGLDPRALRNAFGSFLTGVTIVTTRSADGVPLGFTANSFSSVSLDPPLLLVCPSKTLSSFASFETCRNFAVNILAEDQQEISNTFASFKGDRFDTVKWGNDHNNCPVIDGCVAHFSCRSEKRIDAGDHMILLGHVESFNHFPGNGLGYTAGQYFSLGLERDAAAGPGPGRDTIIGVIIVCGNQVLLKKTEKGLAPPDFQLENGVGVRDAAQEWLSETETRASITTAYSIFRDREKNLQYTYFLAETDRAVSGDLGEFYDIGSLDQSSLVPGPQSDMLMRLALEHETQIFTLYVGDETDGDIHMLSKEE